MIYLQLGARVNVSLGPTLTLSLTFVNPLHLQLSAFTETSRQHPTLYNLKMVQHSTLPEIPGIKAEGELLDSLRQDVAVLLRRGNNIKFPGAQPVSFARKHLTDLCEQDYFLCEKTDGIRCLLYCSQEVDQSEIHYLIDRKNDYYYVDNLHLPHHVNDGNFSRFHTDTILDGELVIDTLKGGVKQLRYLVFDCIVCDGELLTAKTFDKRLGRIGEYIQRPLKKFYQTFPEHAATFKFEVMMKQMEKPYALDDMFANKLPNLPHGNDGLIFTAKEGLYTSGTDESILKWKPPHENSVDFKLKLDQFPLIDNDPDYPDYHSKPTFDLLIYYGTRDYRVYANLFVTDEEWATMKALGQQLDGRIVECYIDAESRWRYKKEADGSPRFRDDKPEANHVSTLHKVIESIEDGVSEQDLCSATMSIRTAWKQRHPEEDRAKRMAQQAPPTNGHH